MLACGIQRIIVVYATSSEALLGALDRYYPHIDFVLDAEQKGSLFSFSCVEAFVEYPFMMMDSDAIAFPEDVRSMVRQGLDEQEKDAKINAAVAVVQNPIFSNAKAYRVQNGRVSAYNKSGFANSKDVGFQGGMAYLWFDSPFELVNQYLERNNYRFSEFFAEYVMVHTVFAMPVRNMWDVDTPKDVQITNLLLKIRRSRAIAFDLDHTVIRNDKTVTERTVQTLHALKERGIRLIIVTARTLPSARQWVEMLASTDVIFSNGAGLMSDGESPTRTFMTYTDANDMLHIIRTFLPKCDILIQYERGAYATFEDSFATHFEQLHDLPQENVERILVKAVTASECTMLMSGLAQENRYSYAHLEGQHLCITSYKATKKTALQALMKRLGLNGEAVIGFGDDINDIDFLMECGVRVAVDNAKPELRDVADFICKSCEEDGVTGWLKQYML